MAELKTQKNDASVTQFLDQAAGPDRLADCTTLVEIMQAATGEKPAMWGTSIVGFGTYRYTYESGRTGEWPVVGFSPRKNDLTLYIIPGFERYADLMAKLGKHKTGKSCLYIKRLANVDVDVLTQLVTESVAAMEPKRVRG